MNKNSYRTTVPKPPGEILSDIIHSNSPLGIGYRRWQAENNDKPSNANEYGSK